MQVRFPLRCLIASLAFELDSTDTRSKKETLKSYGFYNVSCLLTRHHLVDSNMQIFAVVCFILP